MMRLFRSFKESVLDYEVRTTQGFLYQMGSLILNSSRKLFSLNPAQGLLVSYRRLEDCPNKPKTIIPLRDVYGIERLREKSWYQKKDAFYFEISHTKRQVLFCYTADHADSWVQALLRAKAFHEWLSLIKDVRYAETTP